MSNTLVCELLVRFCAAPKNSKSKGSHPLPKTVLFDVSWIYKCFHPSPPKKKMFLARSLMFKAGGVVQRRLGVSKKRG